MNDPIIKSYITDFKKRHNINVDNDSTGFEHFANYCAVSRRVGARFSIESVHVGGGDDLGIDGFAILLNGNLITSIDELEDFERMGSWDVRFIAVQSKSGGRFRGVDMDNFLSGVLEFFKPSATPFPISNHIRRCREMVERIYVDALRFSSSPIIEAVYVSTGEWTGDAHLQARINRQKDALTATKLFSQVKIDPIDAEGLKTTYRELRSMAQREIRFAAVTTLPEVPGAPQAFLGLISSDEYLKLVTDSNGELLPYLFYDNVRDYQGDTAVNKEIRTTLCDETRKQWFALMNNGITVISRDVRQIGQKYILQDFQVVNGCQTTHLLYQNRETLVGSPIFLTLKLIQSNRADLTRLIIRATNRQTEVKDEAFEALSPFHATLEEFFNSMRGEYGFDMYYERRSKQYVSDEKVLDYQVVSLAGLLKAYVSMYIEEPHSTHRYYGEILKSYKSRVFRDDSGLYPYYVSALCSQRVESACRRIGGGVLGFRYHLMMLLKVYFKAAFGIDVSREDGCRKAIRRLLDDDLLKKDLEYLIYLCNLTRREWDDSRRKEITQHFRDKVIQAHSLPARA